MFMNKRQRKKRTRIENKKLINEYPFLVPLDFFTGKRVEDITYDTTILDDMPIGWKKAFGKLLCEDLKNALIKTNCLENYDILQVKEKYGSLRWYDNAQNDEIRDVIEKYEYISHFVCVECGKINVPTINEGWIMPLCEGCYNRNANRKKKHGLESDYQKAICSDAKMNTTFEIKKYSKNGDEIIKYDCSDILKRMKYNI